jgi:hypothetical protein
MKKACAVFTMVYNASVFLPIWLGFYSRFFRADDIYVLDHESTDECTNRSGFVRIPVFNPEFDATWVRDTVQGFQHELIQKYEVVLYSDVDEIVVPHPSVGPFKDYVDKFQHEFVNCNGYEILHIKDKEQPIDLTRPILDQRSYWYHSPRYFTKPLLARIPMEWHWGFHQRLDDRKNLDSNLFLIHLHRMDYDLALSRNQARLNNVRSEHDLKLGLGIHDRYVGEQFEKWFYTDSCALQNVTTIPEEWKGLL